MKINLTATNKQEELILAYLEENASETLIEKINNGTPFEKDGKQLINKKTLSDFMQYACNEARKLTDKNATSACVKDEIVFGWAMHYFEENEIVGTLYNEDGTEYKPTPKKQANQLNAYLPLPFPRKPNQKSYNFLSSIRPPKKSFQRKQSL